MARQRLTPKIIQQDQNRVDLSVRKSPKRPRSHASKKITFIGNEHFDNDTLRKTLRSVVNPAGGINSLKR